MPINIKNFSIDKFNRDVNASYDARERYNLWSGYRNILWEFIERNIECAANKSVAILGAGSLNDVDMRYLGDRFNSITLIDADVKSMEEGLVRQGISEDESEKIALIKADFTGTHDAKFFNKLERLTNKATPVLEVARYIEQAIEDIAPEPIVGLHDVVISCPVYTQLLFTQMEVFLKILYEYGLYEYNELNIMLNAVYQNLPKVLARYNDLMLGIKKKDGFAVMISDVVEMKLGSPLLKRIQKINLGSEEGISMVKNIIAKNGIEIAQEGFKDLHSKIKGIDSVYIAWPFDENKQYLVRACIFKSDETKVL